MKLSGVEECLASVISGEQPSSDGVSSVRVEQHWEMWSLSTSQLDSQGDFFFVKCAAGG